MPETWFFRLIVSQAGYGKTREKIFFYIKKYAKKRKTFLEGGAMDATDRRILAALQADVSGSIAGIADRAGISQTPCWNRIKKLEQAGIIRKRVALVDAAAVGLKLTGYIRLKTAAHNDDWLHKFSVFISSTDEIVECHRLAGDIDYILKIVVPDMSYYDRIYRRLISIVPFSEVSASLSMEEIKFTTELPVRLVK